MEIKEWLDTVAYKVKSECSLSDEDTYEYRSNYDNSYITLVGMEDNVKYLADREITEELTHGVGFSPKDNKWYGWSHRAIYGFEVGSECKKGMCHYTASTPEELIDDRADFFADISKECAERHRAECQILPDRRGIRILSTPIQMPMATIDNLAEALDSDTDLPEVMLFEDSFHVVECGRGEWTAKTMEDAKQMAQDFSSGVS